MNHLLFVIVTFVSLQCVTNTGTKDFEVLGQIKLVGDYFSELHALSEILCEKACSSKDFCGSYTHDLRENRCFLLGLGQSLQQHRDIDFMSGVLISDDQDDQGDQENQHVQEEEEIFFEEIDDDLSDRDYLTALLDQKFRQFGKEIDNKFEEKFKDQRAQIQAEIKSAVKDAIYGSEYFGSNEYWEFTHGTVHLHVEKPDDPDPKSGAGTLVMIGGREFIATAGHNIGDDCAYKIDARTIKGGLDINQYEMLRHSEYDIGLIPLMESSKKNDRNARVFWKVSQEEVMQLRKTLGIILIELKPKDIIAEVIDVDETSNIVFGKSRGRNGFSGLGHIHEGYLYMVHVGNGLCDVDMDDSLNNVATEMHKAIASQENISEATFKKFICAKGGLLEVLEKYPQLSSIPEFPEFVADLESEISRQARNAQTRFVQARFLHEVIFENYLSVCEV